MSRRALRRLASRSTQASLIMQDEPSGPATDAAARGTLTHPDRTSRHAMREAGVHYLNLSRGQLCAGHVPNPHFLRLQSTWCEQKRWADILWTLGPDFYINLARGPVTVHDVSERPRTTRACWQGLVWVRFACERLWEGPEHPAIGRNGQDMTPYFTGELGRLDDRVRTFVRYFRSHYQGRPLSLDVCSGLSTQTADDLALLAQH